MSSQTPAGKSQIAADAAAQMLTAHGFLPDAGLGWALGVAQDSTRICDSPDNETLDSNVASALALADAVEAALPELADDPEIVVSELAEEIARTRRLASDTQRWLSDYAAALAAFRVASDALRARAGSRQQMKEVE